MSKRPTQSQRKKFKERRHQRAVLAANRECPNCHKKLSPNESGHFAPPSFGEEGMFICEIMNNLEASHD